VGAHAKYGMPPFALNAHAMLLPSIHVTVGNILGIRSLHPVAPRQFRLVSSIVSSVSLVVAVLVHGILEHVPASSDHWNWNVQLQRNWNVQVAKKKELECSVAKEEMLASSDFSRGTRGMPANCFGLSKSSCVI
jgi:hypothetical protein